MYSTREAAEVVGVPEGVVRSCARAGLLTAYGEAVSPRAALRFGFRDLLVLRAVKMLADAGLPMRRIRRQLRALREQLPDEDSLAGVSIESLAGQVAVRARERVWRPDTGQLFFDFSAEAVRGELEELPIGAGNTEPEPVCDLTADGWFDRALELEEVDPQGAADAYRRALELAPDCTETLVNLGRLQAEQGDTKAAAQCFREALQRDPTDATALYNLGVVAQDESRHTDAIELYRRALALDPELAEAHYNLATVFDHTGDGRAAIRHINEYRKLTR